MGRDSFILYTGFWKPIQHLSDEQLGRLFRALYEYHTEEEEPEVADDIAMAYGFFVNQFRVDEKKYQDIVEKRRRASRSRYQVQSFDSTSNHLISSAASDVLNVPVNDNENENVNVNVNENENEGSSPDWSHTYTAVMFFRNIKGAEKEAKRFESFYGGNGWRMQGGDYIPVERRIEKAESWKPREDSERFPEGFLERWKVIYDALPDSLKRDAVTDRTQYREFAGYDVITCAETVYEWALGIGREVFTTVFVKALKSAGKTLRIKHY